MKRLSMILCAMAAPALAQPVGDAARAQAEMLATAIDTDRDARIGLDEMMAYGAVLYELFDADEDGEISREEIAAYRFGMTEIAEFRGREQAYDTAQSIIFDVFDRNNDRGIDHDEHIAMFEMMFHFADYDRDGVLSVEEYHEGFLFNIAMRNALADQS